MPYFLPHSVEERRVIEIRRKANEELRYLVGQFQAQMVFNGVTKQDIANLLGKSRNAIGSKFRHPELFTGEEIAMIKQYLNISTTYSA